VRPPRFTSAHAIAIVALIVALAGTTYAASVAPKNSVTSKSVKNNNLTGKDVRNETLSGADVVESSLGEVPLAAASDKATSADTATSAETATSANTAAEAALLDGIDSTGFLSSAPGSVGPGNLGSMPGVWATAQSTSIPDEQDVPVETNTLVDLEQEEFDTGGMYVPGNDFITITRTGTYLLHAYVNWRNNDTTGRRQLQVRLGTTGAGNFRATDESIAGTATTTNETTQIQRFNQGDTISINARQGSATQISLNDLIGSTGEGGIAVQWLGP
jgi:hypothetical protein